MPLAADVRARAARASLSVGLSNRIDSIPSLRKQRGQERFVTIAVADS
jgi:hypothetical protein